LLSIFSQHLDPHLDISCIFLGYFTGSKCFAESTFSGVRTVDIGMVKGGNFVSKQT
jgi:hypothetical protein